MLETSDEIQPMHPAPIIVLVRDGTHHRTYMIDDQLEYVRSS